MDDPQRPEVARRLRQALDEFLQGGHDAQIAGLAEIAGDEQKLLT